MVNAGVVNAKPGSTEKPVFWQKFLVWGRFSAFKNTFNYNRRKSVNAKTASKAPSAARRCTENICVINELRCLNLPLRRIRYNMPLRKRMAFGLFPAAPWSKRG